MKTPFDPRHLKRQQIVKSLFEWSFRQNQTKKNEAQEIIKNLTIIDRLIQKSAPEWPVDKIAKIDLAILRLAIYELAVARKAPVKVIIDEAVELAKEFGGEKSSQFINGALGKAVKNLKR